jgi:hypothetical protein
MVYIPYGSDKRFRILLKTVSGTEYSWFGNRGNADATSTGIWANQSDTSVSPATVIQKINKMCKCTYIDDRNANYGSGTGEVDSDYGGADTYFNGAENIWLEAVAVPETGTANRIVFRHTDTADTSDPFAKVKFFGSTVCSKLGLSEDVWYHGAGFNLSVNEEVESFFRGTVVADEFTIVNRGYFGNNARFSGEMVYDVSGSEAQRQGILFSTGSGVFGRFVYEPFISGSLVEADLIRSKGDVIALYTSDERLKDDIQYILDPVSKVKQLNGVEFKWNDKQKIYPVGTKDVGIIAQDLQKIYPELVTESSTGYLGVKHDRLVALLVEAVKAQSSEIELLKSRITNMEDTNAK